MALATAAVASTTAAALYLDGKYHIRKDLRYLLGRRQIEKKYLEAASNNRVSPYYLFEESALANTDRECIWSRTGSYTWTETYQIIHQYAQFFLSKNIQPGDLVALYLQNCPEFLFAWLALWEIGAAPAMINYNLSGEALVHCVGIGKAREEGPYIVLVDEDPALRGRIEEVRETLETKFGAEITVLDAEFRDRVSMLEAKRVPDSVRRPVRGDWPLALFYTSGTTGMPKGCPINVVAGYNAGARKTGLSLVLPTDRWYNCMPLYHGTGGMSATAQLLTGVTLCLGKKFSVSNFWGDIRDSQATWFTYVGETARYLLAVPPSHLDKKHNVRAMYGNGLRPDVWSRFQERFGIEEVGEFFNSTEGMFSLINYARSTYMRDCVGHHGLILRLKTHNTYIPVRIGADGNITRDPITNYAIREPYHIGGEILVRVPSESSFQGYFKNPSATKKMFARDVFTKGDLFYRTGDKLRRDGEGKWFFMDRLGDTFRWKGENVSTAEVALVLGEWKGVIEANVYGVLVPGHDGRAGCVALFVEEREGFDFKGFLRHARSSLPKYAVPIFVRLVKEATPTHNNKQNKVPLRNEGVDPDLVGGGDVIYWARPGGDTYEVFKRKDWESLTGGRARL